MVPPRVFLLLRWYREASAICYQRPWRRCTVRVYLPKYIEHYCDAPVAMLCASSDLTASLQTSLCMGGKNILESLHKYYCKSFSNGSTFLSHPGVLGGTWESALLVSSQELLRQLAKVPYT